MNPIASAYGTARAEAPTPDTNALNAQIAQIDAEMKSTTDIMRKRELSNQKLTLLRQRQGLPPSATTKPTPEVKTEQKPAQEPSENTLSGVVQMMTRAAKTPEDKAWLDAYNRASTVPEKRAVMQSMPSSLSMYATPLGVQLDRAATFVQRGPEMAREIANKAFDRLVELERQGIYPAKAPAATPTSGQNIPAAPNTAPVPKQTQAPNTAPVPKQTQAPKEGVPQTVSPTVVPTTQASNQMVATDDRKATEKKLEDTLAAMKKTKDPAQWWQILAAIADVGAAGAFGAAGQRYETQAARDLEAEQQEEAANRERAAAMDLWNKQQMIQADIERQMQQEAISADAQREQRGYDFQREMQKAVDVSELTKAQKQFWYQSELQKADAAAALQRVLAGRSQPDYGAMSLFD